MLFVGDLLFKAVSKHNAEELSSIPKHTEVVMCLTEKITRDR